MRAPKKTVACFVATAVLAAVAVCTSFVPSYLEERRLRAEEKKTDLWLRWLSDPDRDSIPEPAGPDVSTQSQDPGLVFVLVLPCVVGALVCFVLALVSWEAGRVRRATNGRFTMRLWEAMSTCAMKRLKDGSTVAGEDCLSVGVSLILLGVLLCAVTGVLGHCWICEDELGQLPVSLSLFPAIEGTLGTAGILAGVWLCGHRRHSRFDAGARVVRCKDHQLFRSRELTFNLDQIWLQVHRSPLCPRWAPLATKVYLYAPGFRMKVYCSTEKRAVAHAQRLSEELGIRYCGADQDGEEKRSSPSPT